MFSSFVKLGLAIAPRQSEASAQPLPGIARDEVPGDPSSGEVRHALGRIVASEAFRASPQLAAFLSFVVETALCGDSKRIKAYTIAIEALGRPQSFDPQTDSIVRVEAGRLRRALEQYYADADADVSVVIDLPRGSYVPAFRRGRAAAQASPAVAPDEKTRVGVARRAFAAAGGIRSAAVGVAVVSVIALVMFLTRDAWIAKAPAPGGAAAASIRAAPVILIQPFEAIGAPASPTFAIDRLRGKLGDAMARFDGMNVVTDIARSANLVAPALWSEYRFTGSAEYHGDGTTTLSFRLVDAGDGTLVWSRMFAKLPAEGDPSAAEDAVAREVASAVAAPFGIVWSHELSDHSARNPRRACLIDLLEYWRKFNPAQHERVRQCLEGMVADDPTYAPGYTGLALVYLRDYYLDIVRPGKAPALDRALQAALHAVELKPDSARAHEVLFVVWFTRGELDQAFATAARALALNPYDTNIIAEYGARLVATGQLDRGMAMLNEAAAYTVVRPNWFDFHLFLGAYLAGDLAGAAQHAAVIENDASPFGLLARALAATAAGNHDKAKQAVDRLVALNSAWRTAPRRQLAKFFPLASIQDRLLHDLEAAGLQATE